MCIGTSHSENTCAEDLYFDLNSRTCAKSSTVDCTNSDGTTTTTTRPPGDDPSPIDPGTDGACDLNLNCMKYNLLLQRSDILSNF